jgi:hypothetical protein
MSFRFSWVLAFLLVQIGLWVFWRLKDGKRGSVYKNASEKVTTVSRKNIDTDRLQWKNRIILAGLAVLALAASGPQIGTRVYFRPWYGNYSPFDFQE